MRKYIVLFLFIGLTLPDKNSWSGSYLKESNFELVIYDYEQTVTTDNSNDDANITAFNNFKDSLKNSDSALASKTIMIHNKSKVPYLFSINAQGKNLKFLKVASEDDISIPLKTFAKFSNLSLRTLSPPGRDYYLVDKK